MDFIKLIDSAIEQSPPDAHRGYIGASSIGNKCLRSIYYGFVNTPTKPYSAKQQRTFEIGKRLEGMIIDYIELAGFRVQRPEPGQYGIPCNDDEIELFSGNMDGLLYLTESHVVVLEIKTAKASEYKKFVETGVKAWKPTYYAQLQSYMGMKKLNRALIVVLCKDNSDWHCEWVEYDDIVYHELRAKAQMVIDSVEPPPKINQNPCWYECQMCKYKEICHMPEPVVVSAA